MTIRTYTSEDTDRVWELLNEIRDGVNGATQSVHMERYASAAQSVPVSDHTPMNYDVSAADEGGITYSPGRFTVPVAGLYLLQHTARFDTNDTGVRIGAIWTGTGSWPSGATMRAIDGNPVATGSSSSDWVTVRAVRRLDAGDFVWFSTWQNSGGSLTTTPLENATRAELTRLGN